MTYFASMTEEDHANDRGTALKSYGRWHNFSNGTGMSIVEAPTADDVHRWAWNWAESMCNVDVTPTMDHNKLREMILGSPPEWTYSYENSSSEPEEGESLYWATYQFYTDSRMKGYEYGCSMKWEEDVEANGKGAIRHVGRWHFPNEGKGFFICAAKDSNDLFVWANKWAPMGTISFAPVLTDKAAAKVVKQKAGYENKLADLVAKMSTA